MTEDWTQDFMRKHHGLDKPSGREWALGALFVLGFACGAVAMSWAYPDVPSKVERVGTPEHDYYNSREAVRAELRTLESRIGVLADQVERLIDRDEE